MFLFGDSVSTEIFPFAFGAMVSLPYAVEVVGGGIDQLGLVGEDSGLEVAVVVAFHADAGTREVGGADVRHGAIEYHYLEVNTRTEFAFQFRPQSRVFVEVLAKVLAWLFGVEQTYLDTSFEQFVEDR